MPLHRGHQLLIETALANVDELTVVVYDTNVPDADMPVHTRAHWVTQLYPDIQNIVTRRDILSNLSYEEKDGPEYAVDYARDLDFLGPFTHVFSSEEYGQPFAEALGAKHVMVDAVREMMPISGTMLRENLYKYRAYVDPIIYRDLIQKVVFVGTESTGKSTLSKALAKEYSTMYTHEYGRTLWETNQQLGIPPTFDMLWRVGKTQYEQEQAASLHSNRFLFCDTNAWTTMLWSEMYFGTADQRLYDLCGKTIRDYIWVLCDNDFGWVDDGMRELENGKSEEFQRTNYDKLNEWGVDFYTIKGPLDKRVESVKRMLESHKAFVSGETSS
jgi:HTH-type transcriptional repressor of NAD biosynthesis genes